MLITVQKIFIGKEDYEEAKTCLGPIFIEIDELQRDGIDVAGIH